jgi:hypothetical protein
MLQIEGRSRRGVRRLLVRLTLFLANRFLLEPHGVTSQKTPFFIPAFIPLVSYESLIPIYF